MADDATDMADTAMDAMDSPGTIVAVAAGNEDLSTLVTAVTAAGLVDTLNSDGPFTVFAPPNSAFDKLPDGTVESLVQPEQKETLTGILTYHVVAGEVMAADLVAAIGAEDDGMLDITTVNGATLTASIVDGAPVLTDAAGNTSNIIATDVDASNGVVHLIDTVVMPG
ncbi:MAG: fasciclin domain-containing protein [Pseudomonadota bacterium]